MISSTTRKRLGLPPTSRSEILTDTADLQECIRQLMRPRNGRRFVAVAFIGKDALDFVPHVSGIEIYCWNSIPGTHPDGLADLINAGAVLKFVPRLHMKVFWSEKGGVLVSSSNLSSNALGGSTTALFEAGYFTSDPSAIDVEALRRRLDRHAQDVTPEALRAYSRRYFAYTADRHNQSRQKTGSLLPTFADYYDGRYKKRWLLAAWTVERDSSRHDIAAANRYADDEGYRGEKRGEDLISDSIETEGGVRCGDWILSYRHSKRSSVGGLKWTYAHTLSSHKKPTALQLIFERGRAPFALDTPFRRSLQELISKHGIDPRHEDIHLNSQQLAVLYALYRKNVNA